MTRTSTRLAIVTAVALCAACSSGPSTDDGSLSDSSPETAEAATEPSLFVESESGEVSGGSEGSEGGGALSPDVAQDLVAAAGRVDIQPTGNRWLEGRGSFTDAPIVVELPAGGVARWIVPVFDGWIAVLDDGSSVTVDLAGSDPFVWDAPGTFDVAAGPPLLAEDEVIDVDAIRSGFADPLPDSRMVTDGRVLVTLTQPTDRYAHGVLGDDLEAAAFEVRDTDVGSTSRLTIQAPDVFEAVSPMLADVDGDGRLDVVVTSANASTGARLSVFDLSGQPIAESESIGRGNRWRNLLAVAPIGPGGEVEVIDVQTPHIGGIVQFFRFDGEDRLERVASISEYSTHSIGSRNLDLGIVTDADGDGQLDVLLPTQDQRALAVLTRDDSMADGVIETFRFDLGDRLSTNVAAANDGGDTVRYAVGTADGLLLLWPSAELPRN